MKTIPAIKPPKHKTINYTDLPDGSAFMYSGDLCVKINIDNGQQGVCLNDMGGYYSDLCGTQVTPANAEVVWSYKEKPKTKKGKSK